MKSVLSFDIDQTLNIAKTPITAEIAELLRDCLDHFEVCPISGQKFDQFLVQIVNPLLKAGATPVQLSHLHLFVAQGTQYYRYPVETEKKHYGGKFILSIDVEKIPDDLEYDENNWEKVYDYPLSDEDVVKITTALEQAAKDTGYW